jgi:hypothetical protein
MGQDPMDADDTKVGWAGSGKDRREAKVGRAGSDKVVVRWANVDGERKGVHCRLVAGAVGG